MDVLTTTLIVSIILGAIGSWTRIAIQWYRDKTLPTGNDFNLSLLIESFLGAVGGGVAWLVFSIIQTLDTKFLPLLYLGAISLGYMAPDALENIFTENQP